MYKLSLKSMVLVGALLASTTVTPAIVKVTWPYSSRQIRCLVDNVYQEARGEPLLGQILVARVTLNRAQDTSICEAVYSPKQFSWTIHKKPINRTSPEYAYAYHAAYAALSSNYEATYYHSYKVRPKWAKKFVRLDKIGNHIFYKAV